MTTLPSLSQVLLNSLGREHPYISLQGGEKLLHVYSSPLTGLDTIRVEWVPMVVQYLVARLVYNKISKKAEAEYAAGMEDVCEVLASVQST